MSTAIYKHSRRLVQRANINEVIATGQLQALKQLTLDLQDQLDSLPRSPGAPIERSLDFYLEVRRFEIALIKQALRLAGGRQKRAAELLNLNGTTLNAMIKRYRIKVEVLPDSTS